MSVHVLVVSYMQQYLKHVFTCAINTNNQISKHMCFSHVFYVRLTCAFVTISRTHVFTWKAHVYTYIFPMKLVLTFKTVLSFQGFFG